MNVPVTEFAAAECIWSRWTTAMHLVVTHPAALADARREVDAELDAVELAASRFRPDSEISQLCGAEGRTRAVSPLLAELIATALDAAARTDGDLDPTLGARLIELGYPGDAAAPVVSVSAPANWTMVTLDGLEVTVPAGVLLDLGATAKAVAADRAARRAHDRTGCGVLVNLGGDIATAGLPPAGGWYVLVQDGDDEPGQAVSIGPGVGLATSSTVRRRWVRGAEHFHHIVDPRSGRPADPVWRTVSVAAPSCAEANTFSTAAVVRGWQALTWLADLGVSARLVGRGKAVYTVGGWAA